jgi:predicted methyltransferase/thiol-disulfide isomerase/thioredoxin
MSRRLRLYSLAILASAALAPAQEASKARGVGETLQQARQEISNFLKAGGKNSDPGHPAEKWARELWKWRDASPGTPDAARATTEAVRLLVYADRFTEAQARADGIPPDDPAWQTLARVLLDSASRQKNHTYFFAKLQSVLSDATDANTRAAIHVSFGRAWRQRRDEKKAEAAFRSALELAGDSPAGKEAGTQLYELLHLGVGRPAPSFSGDAIGGGRLSLADYRGKPLVLVFWFTGCAECVAEVPLLKQLYWKYKERGLEMIGISLDDEPATLERFIAEKGVFWPQLCDGKTDAGVIPKLYNVEGTPDVFVIDRAGNIAARLFSAKQLDRQLAEVTAPDAFPPRTERDSWQRPVEIMEQLRLRAGSAVADVGAGDGYFTFRLAARVGPGGKVFAQDLDEAGLKKVADRAQHDKITQIETIRARPDDPGLKEASLDAILVDAFHEFTHADAMLAGFHRALRPGGRLAVLDQTGKLGLNSSDYREQRQIPQETVISQAVAAGLRLVSFDPDFSGRRDNRAYLVVFEKPR